MNVKLLTACGCTKMVVVEDYPPYIKVPMQRTRWTDPPAPAFMVREFAFAYREHRSPDVADDILVYREVL